MKVTFFENTNDIPYMLASQLRDWGHDARLVTRVGGINLNPYCLPGAHGGDPGASWVTTTTGPSFRPWHVIRALRKGRRAAEKIGHPIITSGAKSIVFYRAKRAPAVWCHGGELKWIPFGRGPKSFLMRAVLRAAPLIISNQPDDGPALKRLGLQHKRRYINTPVSCDFWRPTGAPPPAGRFRVLAPAVLDFAYKGTEAIMRGFARFAKDNPEADAVITMRRQGEIRRAERLAADLGITDRLNLRATIPMKDQVADMEAHHCVIDSVAYGIMGMVSLEAMALNRPAICSVPGVYYADKYGGDEPPVLQASNEHEVAAALRRAYSGDAPRGREWVLRHHGVPTTARRLLEITEDFTA